MSELEAIRSELRAFMEAREWGQFHDPKNLAMCVVSEAGELAAELRWIDNAEADAWCREPEARARLADEVADVAISLLLLCDRIDLDPFEAIRAKMIKNAAKYPVESSRGHAHPPKSEESK